MRASRSEAMEVQEIQGQAGHQPATVYQSGLNSFSSLSSIYSADGGQGDYHITGKVLVGLWHKNETLFVHVVMARGLAGAKAGGLSDPYVKTYLLPDRTKYTKRKTAILRKTNNPEYNETLKSKLPTGDKNLKTLWLSVWDWERFGRNLFLGEVQIALSSLDLTDPTDRWYTLKEKKFEHEDKDKGRLRVAIKFSPYKETREKQKGSLMVAVKEANGLPQMNPHGLTDAAVRVFLLPRRSSYVKKKTACVNDSLDPVWNEQFEYKYVTIEDLRTSRALELTVWDYDRRGCNDFIGCLRLGPSLNDADKQDGDRMDSNADEAEHWMQMLAQPGQWVEAWHNLQPSLGGHCTASVGDSLKSTDSHPLVAAVMTAEDSFESIDEESHESEEAQDSHYGSDTSLYSEGGARGDYTITGKLHIKLEHKGRSLRVNIISAHDLAVADSNGLSDPYVKLYLLPDISKHSKRKTVVKLGTVNPVFNETMLYEVDKSKLPSHTLWFTVWDWDRFGKNKFLGEVKLPLSAAELDGTGHYYNICDNVDMGITDSPTLVCDRGKLKLGLMLELLGSKNGQMIGKLHVQIKSANGLPNMDTLGFTDGFVKFFLLPNKSSKGQRKTKVVKNDLNPVWDETFEYSKVNVEELSSKQALEVTVWDYDLMSSNDFVGGIRIGPTPKPGQTKAWLDSTLEEASHWEEMLACPGEWIERCHTLRSSMDCRDISAPETTVIALPKEMPKEEDTIILLDREEPRSELTISMMLQIVNNNKKKVKANLHIIIKEARCLPTETGTGVFVTCCLLPNKSWFGKKKTKVIKNTENPVWEEVHAIGGLNLDELAAERVLEVVVWDFNKGSSSEFIGGLRLGPAPGAGVKKEWIDSIGEEVHHWEAVLASPGEWVELSHALRTTMDYT